MKKRVPKPFQLLMFFFFLSNCLLATPKCPIVTGKFNEPNGSTEDTSPTGWDLDASNVTSSGFFYVKSNRLTAQTMGGEGIWYSHVFSTAGYSDFQAAVKITAEGKQDNSEYVKIYYKIDGGPETLLDSRTGNFGTIDFTSGTLTGSNIQLIVKIYDYKHGSQASKYYIEQYRVFKEKGPCAVSVINVTATGGALTCSNSSTTLSATASGSGTTTWSWSGPNGFSSTDQNPTVSTAGTYTVVATNSSGTGSASATVTDNQTPPTVSAAGGTLTCATTSVTLNATSSESSSTYNWTGPNGFTSDSQNPVVNTTGDYTLTVTAGTCSATATATVNADTAPPDINASATPIQLTCVATNATLNGSSSTTGATFSWSNGNGVIATTPNASISTPGTYTLTVTNPANSCTATSQVVVTQNVTPPTAISASNTGTVTCSNPTVSINGTVSASGLTYSWIGPNGFTSSALNTTVKKGGTYTLTATDPTNGCSVSTATVVPENTAVPGEISIHNSGTITCLTSSVTVSGSSSSTGVNYTWTGPNGYSSSSSSITVTHGGLYTLTATDPVNGCKATKSATIAENSAPPAVTIGNTSPLSCKNPTVTLTATTTVPNVSYLWIGPGDFIAVTAVTTTNVAGNYVLTVTDPGNGCTNTLSVNVTGDPANCSARKVTSGAAGNTTASDFTHSAYPNPVTSNGVIQFTSPLNTTVSVGIYNTLGACEKVLFKGVANANQQYRLSVPVDQLHAGAYYYIINTNEKVYTGKLVIVK